MSRRTLSLEQIFDAHLHVQLFRLELQDPNARRKLRRLSQRLLALSHVLDHIAQE